MFTPFLIFYKDKGHGKNAYSSVAGVHVCKHDKEYGSILLCFSESRLQSIGSS